MVANPLLETKLYVPRSQHGLVPRPRLSERLDRGAASKLLLVSAPAGFGRTTLLAEWLAAEPAAPIDERCAAWLSLDRGDNDPASFWTYVVAALRTVEPAIGASGVALLQESQPSPAKRRLPRSRIRRAGSRRRSSGRRRPAPAAPTGRGDRYRRTRRLASRGSWRTAIPAPPTAVVRPGHPR